MTDWDSRWRDMKSERIAEVQREHQAKLEAELNWKEYQDAEAKKAAEYNSELLDVARWAVRQYRSAGIAPLNVYAKWWTKDRLRSFFDSNGKTVNKSHRIRVAKAYPLALVAAESTHDQGADYPPRIDTSYYLWLFTVDEKFVSVHLNYWGKELTEIIKRATSNISEVEIFVSNADECNDLDLLFTKENIHASSSGIVKPVGADERVGSRDHSDWVVNYVGQRIDPTT